MSYLSKKNHPKSLNGFYNKFDKYDKTCYKGMEQHFYGRESKGPGAYLKQDFVHLSPTKEASKFSVPKNDRGLLTNVEHPRRPSPGPGKYENEKQRIAFMMKTGTFAMPKASRDISFSKYGSQHSTLVSKGLY